MSSRDRSNLIFGMEDLIYRLTFEEITADELVGELEGFLNILNGRRV